MVDGSAGGILDREALIGIKSYWRQVKLEYTSNLPDYIGCNADPKAATSEGTWAVWKYSWTGSDCTEIQGPITGSWDNRATLDWV